MDLGRYKSRKFLMTFLSLGMSFGLAWHSKWPADGWALVMAAILGTHAAGNVMDTKYGKAA